MTAFFVFIFQCVSGVAQSSLMIRPNHATKVSQIHQQKSAELHNKKNGPSLYKSKILKMKEYKSRIADLILRQKLESSGAVLIQGPKWCGKTTTAEQLAASKLYMNDPDEQSENLKMASMATPTMGCSPF